MSQSNNSKASALIDSILIACRELDKMEMYGLGDLYAKLGDSSEFMRVVDNAVFSALNVKNIPHDKTLNGFIQKNNMKLGYADRAKLKILQRKLSDAKIVNAIVMNDVELLCSFRGVGKKVVNRIIESYKISIQSPTLPYYILDDSAERHC